MIKADRITKRYGDIQVLDGISLEIPGGAAFSLSGASGSGKTTLLRLIAGLDVPDSGTISLSAKPVSSARDFVPPERRGVAIVFQRPALWPHLSVEENVAFAVSGRSEARRRTNELLAALGLESAAKRKPQNLSGGEAQRVALARALAPRSKVLLLDEPFSNLDQASRLAAIQLLKKERSEAGWTLLLVTHEPREAAPICEEALVLNGGRAFPANGTGE